MQLVSRNYSPRDFMSKEDMFPEELPEELKEELIKIEVLLEYGHIKSALECMVNSINDSPAGMAYHRRICDLDDDRWVLQSTWMCFNRRVLELVNWDDKRMPQMKSCITRELNKGDDGDYKETALYYVLFVLKGDNEWIGELYMDPTVSDKEVSQSYMQELLQSNG